MATLRQKKLAKAIVENASAKIPKNKKELLVSAGYDETTAEATPGFIIDQIGVQEELASLGFSVEGAKKVVQEILYDKRVKAEARLKASDQVFKVHGAYAAEKHANVNVNLEAGADIKDLTQKLNDLYRGTSGIGDGGATGSVGVEARDQK